MKRLHMVLCCLLAATIILACVGCHSAGVPQAQTPTTDPEPTTTAESTTQTTAPTVPPTTVPPPYVGSALGSIDWQLHITRISTHTGQPLDGEWTFTVKGEILDKDEEWVSFFLDLSFGKHLPYHVAVHEEGLPVEKIYFESYGYYTTPSPYSKPYTNELGVMSYALDPINGLAIFVFDDGTGHFYVGSVNPDVDPMDIYERFSEFVEWNS